MLYAKKHKFLASSFSDCDTHAQGGNIGASITITKYMYMWLKIYQRISKVVKSLILIKVMLMLSIVLLSKVMLMDIFTEPIS